MAGRRQYASPEELLEGDDEAAQQAFVSLLRQHVEKEQGDSNAGEERLREVRGLSCTGDVQRSWRQEASVSSDAPGCTTTKDRPWRRCWRPSRRWWRASWTTSTAACGLPWTRAAETKTKSLPSLRWLQKPGLCAPGLRLLTARRG